MLYDLCIAKSLLRRSRSRLEQKVGSSNISPDKPKSQKQVVTAQPPNTRQQMRVSWVLGDDHHKRMIRVTVGVIRLRTLSAQ